MTQLTEEELKELAAQGKTIVSPTKPGPGWVRVDDNILKTISEVNAALTASGKRLEQLEIEIKSILSTRMNSSNFNH